MEWLIIGAVVVIGFMVVSSKLIGAAKGQQDADPDKYLDEWFDGRDQVIVKQGPTTLSSEAILAGGNARGYRLVSSDRMPYPHNNSTEMIFEKVATA